MGGDCVGGDVPAWPGPTMSPQGQGEPPADDPAPADPAYGARPAPHAADWYPGGQYPTGPHPAGQYPTGPYPAGPYPTGPYPAGPYPTGPYPTGAYRTGTPTGSSAMAIASLVTAVVGIPLSFLFGIPSLVAVVLGIVAVTQIRRTGQQGLALAVAGIAVGAVTFLFVVAAVVMLVVASNGVGNYYSY